MTFYCHSLKRLFLILLGKPLSFIPEEGGAEGIPGVQNDCRGAEQCL